MNGEPCRRKKIQVEGEVIRTPDVLTGKKYTRKYRGDKLYFHAYPCEVFINSDRDKDDYEASLMDSLTRFISMSLRLGNIEDVLDQLKKSSRSKRDIPGILYDVLGGK